jgi:two-component system, NarL family, response regulator LiaR
MTEQSPNAQPEPIRVLIVDDHTIVREGLRALIEGRKGFTIAGEAADGEQAIRQARLLKPHVILMDLKMPNKNGIDAIRAIKAENEAARILVLTSYAEDEQVFAAIQGGALGYLLKDSSPQELLEAIRCVFRGEASLHPTVARKLILGMHRPAGLPNGDGHSPAASELTEREVEVLRLVARGLSNAEIAGKLSVGEGTVRFHVSNILSKLSLENRTQAVLYALRHGVVRLEEI